MCRSDVHEPQVLVPRAGKDGGVQARGLAAREDEATWCWAGYGAGGGGLSSLL